MKKFLYSKHTKIIAVLLFIAGIVLGALTVTNGIAEYCNQREQIYGFESSFNEAKHFSSLLEAPESAIVNAYHSLSEISVDESSSMAFTDPGATVHHIMEEPNTEENGVLKPVEIEIVTSPDEVNHVVAEGTPRIRLIESETTQNGPKLYPLRIMERKITADEETLKQNIEKKLNSLYCADKINYYVKWNDTVWTNCGAMSEKELMGAQFYRLTKQDEQGYIERESSQNLYQSYPLLDQLSQYDTADSVIVCTSVKEAYADACKIAWYRQENIVNTTFTASIIYGVFSLLIFIYLLCVCGKNSDGEDQSMWIDHIWAEVHFAAMGCCALAPVTMCLSLLNAYISGSLSYSIVSMSVGVLAAIASGAFITFSLSVIRNLKRKRFVESSVVLCVVRWCWRLLIRMVKRMLGKIKSTKIAVSYTLSKKAGILYVGMLFVYTVFIGFAGVRVRTSVIWGMLGILLFLFASFVMAHRAKDFDEIKKGVNAIRNGNVTHKIPELNSEDMKAVAANINDIAKGLDESVSAKVRAERLKTELITNVSHDLKTPITSIISYAELLSNIEELPEEAKDYVSVISKKSERLKNLTQDLFDISKAQSGNEDVTLEKLDVALLISQSLGEHDSEVKESGLIFCVNAAKELYISADGRKMSRVISNLISNILKYTMKNTRVFISAYEENGEIVMEFKNISSYPMNFHAEEIVGRFVRGDESRTREGNGLGLAIAKSYTEICNGKFDVILDGDLFKVLIRFSMQ